MLMLTKIDVIDISEYLVSYCLQKQLKYKVKILY